MRTPRRLDPRLLAKAKALAVSSGRSLMAVISDALRKEVEFGAPQPTRFNVQTLEGTGVKPGVELHNSASLLDVMER